MSDIDLIGKIFLGLVVIWMLWDLTFGWSSPRGKRKRDARWDQIMDDLKRERAEDERRPCYGKNSNVCVAEGCFGDCV